MNPSKKQIPFTVSARTAKLIGFENFSNGDGAVVELVKNTYDADARNCVIVFDMNYLDEKRTLIDRDRSKIYIADNGIGMSEATIATHWMMIGTNNKVTEFLSEKDRVRSGAKGIGRFALNRLGRETKLYTYSRSEQSGLEWEVNWSDFDVAGKSVSDINAIIDTVPNMDIKGILRDKFSHNPSLQARIENIPFDSGTIIEISLLQDSWEEDSISKLYGNLEMLLPPKEERDFQITLLHTADINRFGEVKTAYYDDFDYKVKAHYDGNDGIEVVILRNELDLDQIKSNYKDVFEMPDMQKSPYRWDDMKEGTIVKKLSLKKLFSNVSQENLANIGAFDFTFYFLKLTKGEDRDEDKGIGAKYPYKSINSSHRKSWLRKFGGVKIFRDEFRVRPYGEQGDDWLRLGERQAQSPGGPGQKRGGYRIGPNQISGSVHISRIHNEAFQDKSGREGIIENDTFVTFKNLLIEIIHAFEEDRNMIMYNFSESYKKKGGDLETIRRAEEIAANVRKRKRSSKGSSNATPKAEDEENAEQSQTEDLAKGVEVLSRQLTLKEDELRLLRSLASTGLIVSSFAHELRSLEARLIPRTEDLISTLKEYITEDALQLVNRDDNPFYMIELMRNEDRKIKNWLEYALNTIKRDKRERSNLNFSLYFDRLKSTWGNALQRRGISFQITGDDACVMRAFEVDMDSVFNNLISNSIYAFRGNGEKPKNISIQWKRVDGLIEIIFSDTGPGLSAKYHENPDKIFDFNETSKQDRQGNVTGTGLGLYIVKSILEEYHDSAISVIKHADGLSFKISFQLPLGPIE